MTTLATQLADASLLVAAGLFLLAVVAYRRGYPRLGKYAAADGWIWFAVLWLVTVPDNLAHGRMFLSGVHVLTAVVGLYGAYLVMIEADLGVELTHAVGVMTALFAPVEVFPAVHRLLVNTTAEATAGLLVLLGFSPSLEASAAGYRDLVVFASPQYIWVHITTACTGISAILLFTGLISVTSESRRRKLTAIAGVSTVIFLANTVRNAFVGAAMGGGMFEPLLPVLGPLVGTSDPHLLSYYLAEMVLTRLAIVCVLVGLSAVVAYWFPGIGSFLARVRRRVRTDTTALRRWLHSRRSKLAG